MRYRLVAVSLVVALVPTMAGAQSSSCEDLQKTYQQEMDSASSLKAQAAQKAVSSGTDALSQLGIDLGSSTGTQQAIQKGALAASSPQVQGAILIQLLSANTHLQELMWRGCKPPSSSG